MGNLKLQKFPEIGVGKGILNVLTYKVFLDGWVYINIAKEVENNVEVGSEIKLTGKVSNETYTEFIWDKKLGLLNKGWEWLYFVSSFLYECIPHISGSLVGLLDLLNLKVGGKYIEQKIQELDTYINELVKQLIVVGNGGNKVIWVGDTPNYLLYGYDNPIEFMDKEKPIENKIYPQLLFGDVFNLIEQLDNIGQDFVESVVIPNSDGLTYLKFYGLDLLNEGVDVKDKVKLMLKAWLGVITPNHLLQYAILLRTILYLANYKTNYIFARIDESWKQIMDEINTYNYSLEQMLELDVDELYKAYKNHYYYNDTNLDGEDLRQVLNWWLGVGSKILYILNSFKYHNLIKLKVLYELANGGWGLTPNSVENIQLAKNYLVWISGAENVYSLSKEESEKFLQKIIKEDRTYAQPKYGMSVWLTFEFDEGYEGYPQLMSKYEWKLFVNSKFVRESKYPSPSVVGGILSQDKYYTLNELLHNSNFEVVKLQDKKLIDYNILGKQMQEFFDLITNSFKYGNVVYAKNFLKVGDWIAVSNNIISVLKEVGGYVYAQLQQNNNFITKQPYTTYNIQPLPDDYKYQSYIINQLKERYKDVVNPKTFRDYIWQVGGLFLPELLKSLTYKSGVGGILTPNSNLFVSPILPMSPDFYINNILNSPYFQINISLYALPTPIPLEDISNFYVALPSHKFYNYNNIIIGFSF